MVAHICSHRTWDIGQKDQKFKASYGYLVSLGSAWATYGSDFKKYLKELDQVIYTSIDLIMSTNKIWN